MKMQESEGSDNFSKSIRRWLTASLIITITLLFIAVANANPALQEALDNYQENNFESAAEQFKLLAEMGFSTAQYNFGVMYLKGQSVDQDPLQAYAWIGLAAVQQESFADTAATVLQALPDDTSRHSARLALASLQQNFGVDAQTDKLLREGPEADQQQEFELIKTRPPIYPSSALAKRLGGYNMTEFWVFPDGSVRLPSVLYSVPGELFDAASLDAITHFKVAWTGLSEQDPRPVVSRQVIDYRIRRNQKSRPSPQLIKHINGIRKRAEAGDAYAQYLLAVSHLYLDISDMDDRRSWALLLDAAWAGIPEAQHMVGMHLSQDWREASEREHGGLWINISALGDYPAISYSVARNGPDNHAAFAFDDISRIDLVNLAAAQDYAPAVIHHSMITATAGQPPDQKSLDQARAALQAISGWYRGEPYWHVASAAVAAASGNFTLAAEHQHKAIRKAAALDWESDDLEQALASFEQGERLIIEPEQSASQRPFVLAALPDQG